MEILINGKSVKVEEYEKEIELNEKLIGKDLLEQVDLLKILYEYYESKSSYGNENESYSSKQEDLINCDNIINIYTFKNTIVGVKVKVYSKEFDLTLNSKVNTYFACEDDGPSSTSVSDYATLLLKE